MAKPKHCKAKLSTSKKADNGLMIIDAVSTNDISDMENSCVDTSQKRKRSNIGRIIKRKKLKIRKHKKINRNSEENASVSSGSISVKNESDDYPSFMKAIHFSSDDDLDCEETVPNYRTGHSPNLPATCQTSSRNIDGSSRNVEDSSRNVEDSSRSVEDSSRNIEELSDSDDHTESVFSDCRSLCALAQGWRNSSNSVASNSDSHESNDEFLAEEDSNSIQLCPCKQSEQKVPEAKNNAHVIAVPKLNMEVVVLEHPSSIVLYKYITVRVLSGSVSIHGYQINHKSLPVPVFSSEKTGLIKLTTDYAHSVWKEKHMYTVVKRSLQHDLTERLTQKILSQCGASSVLIILQRIPYPPPLQFLQLYYPSEFKFPKNSAKDQGFASQENADEALSFNLGINKIVECIKARIRKSEVSGSTGQRIMVYGPQNSGKSTLLRYIINRVLRMFNSVYYLDADPGQTEFSPPGVVSITKVNKPIIGPPFVHQKGSVKMIFTGSHSADTSPPMYQKSIFKLISFFNSTHPSKTLFVNTMGWLQGIGLECLFSLINAVEPTIVIEMMDENKPSAFDCEEFFEKKVKKFKIKIEKPKCTDHHLQAPMMRNLAIMSYFGRCQMPHLPPMYLNSFRPFCVCWDKIAVYIFGKKLGPQRIIETINASIVALCTVDESLILESDVPGFQQTLQDEPDNDCLGFGVVRAVDEENHLLYIVTPLPLQLLSKVNAILRGNILLPDAVYLKQPIYNIPIPYVDRPVNHPVHSRKSIPKRIRRKKQK